MKRIILLVANFIYFSNAYAVCPKTINGVWSGTKTNTETGFIITDSGLVPTTQVGNGLITLLFSESTVTLIQDITAESGPQAAINNETGEGKQAPFSYDRAKCSATIDTGYSKIVFTLTDNGKVLNGIGSERKYCNESKCLSGTSQAFKLERQ